MNTEDEVVIPEEHPKYPGYYIVPGDELIAIKPTGECISTHTGNLLAHYDKDGYRCVSCLNPVKSPNGRARYHKVRVHRLLALTFLGRPAHLKEIPYEKLVVKPIDHNQWNCNLKNLEWCTQNHKLQVVSKPNKVSPKVVLARDIRSNQVKRFPSVGACALEFDINSSQLSKHLRSPWVGRITHNWCVFMYDDVTHWPEIPLIDQIESMWSHDGFVLMVKDDNPIKIVVVNTLKDAADYLGITYKNLADFRHKHGPLIPFHDWIITYHDAVMGYDVHGLVPTVDDWRKKPRSHGTLVRITDTMTNLSQVYSSIPIAAKALGVSSPTIINSIEENRNFSVHFKAEKL